MAMTNISRCTTVRSAAKQGLCPTRVCSRRSISLRCRAKDPREDAKEESTNIAEKALDWVKKQAVPEPPSGSGPLDYAMKPSDIKHAFQDTGAILKGEADRKNNAVKESARNTADVTKEAVNDAV
ncbi:hypothetical protein HaLaN_11764, partial [Haematococcus lacustris]